MYYEKVKKFNIGRWKDTNLTDFELFNMMATFNKKLIKTLNALSYYGYDTEEIRVVRKQIIELGTESDIVLKFNTLTREITLLKENNIELVNISK